MEFILYTVGVVLFVSFIGFLCAVSYSALAPDWYEEEERNRRNWYK